MTEFPAESVTPTGRAEPPPEAARPQPRPGRHRAGTLAVAVATFSLLTAGAGGCSSSSSGHTGQAGQAAAGPATGIQAPARIGTLTKQNDDKSGMSGSGVPPSVLKNLHTLSYSASAGPYVLINGGPGLPVPTDGSPDKIKRLFSEWDVGSAGEALTSVPTGSAGGTAECTPYNAPAKGVDCGWVSGKVALVMSFSGFPLSQARALVPKILSAMATR